MSVLTAYWTGVLPEKRTWVTIRQTRERGFVWAGILFAVQEARNLFAICSDDGRPARYFRREELDWEDGTATADRRVATATI